MGRKELFLSSIIVEYLRTRAPIGSQSLKMLTKTKLSSATIRNYFKALSDDGLLYQSHTSGGRIPTHSALLDFWRRELDTSEVLELGDLARLKEAAFSRGVFCAISSEKSNRLQKVTRISESSLLLELEDLGVSLTHTPAQGASIERFLGELIGLELSDVRRFAASVRANKVLEALSIIPAREIMRFNTRALLGAFDTFSERSDEAMLSIIDGRIFESLDRGIAPESIFLESGANEGFGAMFEANVESKRAKLFVAGAITCDFGGFIKDIAIS